MSNDAATWKLIHRERATLADTLEQLSIAQWTVPSLCGGWTVQMAAGHVMAGAEQTRPNFVRAMAVNGFRFNTMIDRVARRSGELAPDEIIARLRACTATTNGPPAPVVTMLGEIVVHAADICEPLGITGEVAPEALTRCLAMYTKAGFPVGTKKRIDGLKLVATDLGWSHGSGPEVSGPAQALLLAMTGRSAGLGKLAGEGVPTLQARMTAA